MRRAAHQHRPSHLASRPAEKPKRLTSTLSLAVLCLAASVGAAQAQSVSSTPEYRQTIEQARAGNHEAALQWLEKQAQLHPADVRIRYDQIIISGWAGRHQEAMRLHQALPPDATPLPRAVLAAAAQAYRDGRIWPTSLSLYREGLQRFPKDPVFAAGEVRVLADAGQTQEAVDQARRLLADAPNQVWALMALSYAHRRAQHPYAALPPAEKAYNLAPDNPDAVNEYLDTLVQGRMAGAALSIARARPDFVGPERIRRLEVDRAAELTRLSSMPTRREEDRFVLADQALVAYEAFTPSSTPGVQAPDLAQRARIDRLLALHARSRMRDVVQEYEALTAEGVVVPHYALGVVADAYLDLRRPEKASELYVQILSAEQAAQQTEPSIRLSHQSGLFYSYLETERFDDALELAESARNEQPHWLKKKGTPLPHPNDLSLEASHQAAVGHLYADDVDQAQERLETLVNQAPGHSGLRSSLAEVYIARGWPRRAEEELKLAETQTPRALTVIVGQAHAAMALQEWRQAEVLIEHAQARYPENGHVRQLVRDWTRHNRSELQVTGHSSLASDSPVAGNGDLAIDAVIYTPPIQYNWRGFAGGGYATADFEENDFNYHWYRGGAEWRSRGLSVEAEVSSHHYGQGGKTGARVLAAYELNDQWRISGQYAFRSRETPMRALANDITSNRLDAQVRWSGNERRHWTFTLSPSRFSDGNRRIEASVAGQEPLYTSPHVKLDALLDVYASQNSHEEAPYFNPRADLSVLPALALTHILHRRYENVLEQRFMAGAGLYSQRHYGTGGIVAVGYGLRYRFSEAVNAGVSITGISRPYDGQREREARIMFDLQVRF